MLDVRDLKNEKRFNQKVVGKTNEVVLQVSFALGVTSSSVL
jgi:hypothetical protein